MKDKTEAVHLLWTGGWDSTYRLLYLLRKGATVQPHYIVDPNRPSSDHELKAMEAIRASIADPWVDLPGVVLPLKVSSRPDRVQSAEVEQAFNMIMRRMYIGDQYRWLADYCESKGIEGMEIGVEENPVILKAINCVGYPSDVIFGKFSFPILSTSKIDMKQWAESVGMLPILEQAWFCHTPTSKNTPCGKCHPCEVTIKGGIGYRVPLASRIRYALRIFPRLKAFIKLFPRCYYLLYRMKHGN